MVPADCVLRDLPAILLERTLPTSSLAALATADEFRAAVLLYFATYDEVPAGSLPDEPALLAQKARMTPKQWAKSSAIVMRGWVKCSDGRFYHATTCEKVLIAWIGRLKRSVSGQKGNAARWGTETAQPDRADQLTRAMHALARLNPESSTLRIAAPSQGDRNAIPPRSQVQGKGEGLEKSPSQETAEVIELGGMRA